MTGSRENVQRLVWRGKTRVVRYSRQWWLKNFFSLRSWVRKMMYKFKLSLKYSIEKRHAWTSLWSNFSIDHYYRWFPFINTCIPTTLLSLSLLYIYRLVCVFPIILSVKARSNHPRRLKLNFSKSDSTSVFSAPISRQWSDSCRAFPTISRWSFYRTSDRRSWWLVLT